MARVATDSSRSKLWLTLNSFLAALLQVVLFLFLGLLLMCSFICCLWCCFSVWDKRRAKALKARIEARKAQSNNNAAATSVGGQRVQLSNLPVSAAFRGSSSNSDATVSSSIPRATVTVTTQKKKTGAQAGELQESLLEEGKETSNDATLAESSRSNGGRRFEVRLNEEGEVDLRMIDPSIPPSPTSSSHSAPISFPPPLPPLSRNQSLLRSAAKGGLVMSLLAVLIAVIVACLLFPHMPLYSMCDKNIGWGTILKNMQSGALKVDVDLHVAVWNPNRFHLQLNSVTARILYAQDVVGVGSVRNVGFHAGSIEDFILTVAFSPSISSAASMLRDHLRGSLLLDVLFDIDTSVLLSKFTHPLLQVNTTYVFENIDAEGAVEREYCKCQDPDVKALQPTTRIGSRVQRTDADVLQRPRVNVLARIAHTEDGQAQIQAVSSNTEQNQQAEST